MFKGLAICLREGCEKGRGFSLFFRAIVGKKKEGEEKLVVLESWLPA